MPYKKTKTDERDVEYYEDEHFIWKIEGSVLTMLRTKPFVGCADEKAVKEELNQWRTKNMEERLQKLKERGITIIEYWIHKGYLDFIKAYHEEHGRKFEVVREEPKLEVYLCRLYL